MLQGYFRAAREGFFYGYVAFCFLGVVHPARKFLSMAVDHGASSAAAAASPDELAPEEASPDSGAKVKVGLLAAGGPTPSEAGRAPSKRKPKIDIDNETQEANRLAELFRKMQNASKVAARNATRSKQRLMRKANKLSEQDLMRLAVLKRCGIFAPEEDETVASPTPLEVQPLPVKLSKAQEHISGRFKTLVSSVPGAAEVFEGLDKSTNPVVYSLPALSKSSSSVLLSGTLPKAVGLKRLPSRAAVPVSRKRRNSAAKVTDPEEDANLGTSSDLPVDDEE